MKVKTDLKLQLISGMDKSHLEELLNLLNKEQENEPDEAVNLLMSAIVATMLVADAPDSAMIETIEKLASMWRQNK